MKISVVTCVKNEGPFLLEWIAFHRVIGASDFLFYSNDCTDGTDKLLDALAESGIVEHFPNPAKNRNYQMEALRDARKKQIVQDADWVWIADVDEFLNIHCGNGTIPDLISHCGTPQAVSVTFQFFANAGVDAYKDRLIIEQFTHSHNPDIWHDQTAIEVKTLTNQSFPVFYFGAHRPFLRTSGEDGPDEAVMQGLNWADGSGRQVPKSFIRAQIPRRMRKFPARGCRAHATLNHYALRSLDSYLVKNDRGDVNRENREFALDYWNERNDPAYKDTSIHKYLDPVREEIDYLKSLPGVADLHRLTVQRHKALIKHLRTLPDYQELRKSLQGMPTIPPSERAYLAQYHDLASHT